MPEKVPEEKTDHAAELLAWFAPSVWQHAPSRAVIEAVRPYLNATLNELFALRDLCGKSIKLADELKDIARALTDRCAQIRDALTVARPLSEWHEDHGHVLWWEFPVEAPPYCGTPTDDDWPGQHTHWTPLFVPTRTSDECG